MGKLASNATNPATSGTIRRGNNKVISRQLNNSTASESLTLDGQKLFAFSSDLTMNWRYLQDISNIRSQTLNPEDNGSVRMANTAASPWSNRDKDGHHQ